MLMATERDTLTVKEVAALLGYEEKYTYTLIRDGVIPGRRLGPGRKITVSRRELMQLFPNQTRNN